MKPEPKFKVGQAVMVRSERFPQQNSDFSIVLKQRYSIPVHGGWGYLLNNRNDVFEEGGIIYGPEFLEESLRPIPPEEHNGIDAFEFIKDPLRNPLVEVE